MKETKVGEIRKLITVKPAVVVENEQIENVIKQFIDNPIIRAVYVVDKKYRLVGIITMQDIL
ncbi:MAG: CBS domain-containing protein, partial [Spirochaetaceae bacterium]|nr:CBS domain-containing protein [Spirochaetaceae bacterium]